MKHLSTIPKDNARLMLHYGSVLFLEWWKDASFLSGLLGQEGLASPDRNEASFHHSKNSTLP
jgi:hypothetical protein